MAIRKYAGLGLGLALSMLMVASVMASTIGPNRVFNVGPGWNSEIYVDNTQNTTSFSIYSCLSSDTTLVFDLMHHWFGTPSTGTALKTLSCVNDTTLRTGSWANVATADYSIEYARNQNSATATYTYKIIY